MAVTKKMMRGNFVEVETVRGTPTKLYTAMLLSEEEAGMIEATRAEKAAQARMGAETAKLLATASGYDRWLSENGRPATYSTFCEYLGNVPFPARHDHYLAVCQIISAAERCAKVTAETVSEE